MFAGYHKEFGLHPMNTQTHVLIATALFARSGVGNRARNVAAVAGGFLPDLPIYLMFLWSKIVGAPEMEVWETWYFNPPWQTATDLSHSFVLYWLIAMIGVWVVKWGGEKSDRGVVMVIFALAAISHGLGDFLLHVNDGHAHFWPLSGWRFSSPVSYWDPRYYGQYFSIFEILLGIGLSVVLFRRFSGRIVRLVLVLCMAAYIVVPAYFVLVVGHH